jgi:Ca2+-binding RTX toxin-like protein
MDKWRRWLVIGGTAGMVVAIAGVARADDEVHLPPLDGEQCEAKALAAAAAGFNVVVGTALADVPLNGGPGRDLIIGLEGNDLINGGGGNDLILAGDGDDLVNGGAGRDTLCLGGDDDLGNGNSENDQIFGESGVDTGDGGLGNDVCAPDVENPISC